MKSINGVEITWNILPCFNNRLHSYLFLDSRLCVICVLIFEMKHTFLRASPKVIKDNFVWVQRSLIWRKKKVVINISLEGILDL